MLPPCGGLISGGRAIASLKPANTVDIHQCQIVDISFISDLRM